MSLWSRRAGQRQLGVVRTAPNTRRVFSCLMAIEVRTSDHVSHIVLDVLRHHGVVNVTTITVTTAKVGWTVAVSWGPAGTKRLHVQQGSPSAVRCQIVRQLGV